MTREEHLLSIVSEECAETSKRATKALRFGMGEVQPEQDLNNATRLLEEYGDIVGAIEMLAETSPELGQIFTEDNIRRYAAAKREKVEKFLEYSRSLGKLDS